MGNVLIMEDYVKLSKEAFAPIAEVDFQGFKVLEDPYWDKQDDRWVINYTVGDGYSFEAEAGDDEENPEDPDPGDDEEENGIAWDSNKVYVSGDIVTYEGNTYTAKNKVEVGIEPSKEGKYWQKNK